MVMGALNRTGSQRTQNGRPAVATVGKDLDLDSHSLLMVLGIAEHGSITAASEALGYSQPAVSQHVRRLESRLGMPVLERTGRSVRLTEAGTVLARHAQTVATALNAA